MVEREQISDAVFSGNNTQPDSFADYRMAGGMALTPTERSVQTSQDYLDTSLDFPLANNSQKKTDVAQAQDPSGERARELPTDPEVQKANGFATFLSSNMSRKPSDRDLNDRTAEWLRNRFEEDMAGGGKPEQLQAKMNEALASSGLQVTFRPNAPGSSYYRESAIEIRDTTRTQNDLFGRPIHPVIGAANGAGMNLPRSRN